MEVEIFDREEKLFFKSQVSYRSGSRTLSLEADFKASSGGRGQSFQGLSGWPSPPTFKSGDDGLGCGHALRKLLLGEPCDDTSIDECAGKRAFRGKLFMSFFVFFVLHPFLMKVVYFGHCVILFERFNAAV